MKLLGIHDAKGNIARIVVCPPNAPAGATAAEPGQFVTEIEAPGVEVDPGDPANYQRLKEVLENFQVEVKTEGKLVRKTHPEEG
jgi:hypothetical protein